MAGKDDDILISVSTDLTQIKRQLRELGQSVAASTGDVVKRFEATGRGIDRSMKPLQDTINRVTGVMVSSGKEWQGALARPSAQLDELRQKFVPLYAETKKYEAELVELNRAHAIGAVTSKEYDAALSRLNARYQTLSSNAAVAAKLASELQALTAKFNPLAAAATKYESSLNEVSRAEKIGAVTASEAIQLRLKLTNTYNAQVAALNGIAAAQKNAAQAAVNKVTVAPNRAADIAAYGKQLDALRAKYNPLYAAQQQYLVNLKDIKTAHAIGAISANEMAAAVTREKAAFAGNVVAMRNAGVASGRLNGTIKLSSNQMLNLSRQGNDVITMFALGAPPMQIFASQAGQIYDALEQGQGGVRGSLKAIATGLAGLVTPAGLAATAFASGAAAFIAYEVAGADSIDKLDVIIKRHADNIKLLGDAYDEVATKQKKIAVVSVDTANLISAADAKKIQDRLKADIENIFTAATTVQLNGDFTSEVVKAKFAPFEKAITDLNNSAKDTAALRAFTDTVTEIASANPQYSEAATALLGLANAALTTAQAVPEVTRTVDEVGNVVASFQAAMNDVNSAPLQKALQDIFDKARDGKLSVDEINDAIAALDQANPSFSGIIDAIGKIILQARGASQAVADIYAKAGGGSPNGRHVNPIGLATDSAVQDAQYNGSAFVPTPAPNREDLGAEYDKAVKKAGRKKATPKTADDRFFEDIEAIRQRTAALAQEQSMLGATFEEQTKRKTAFDLEQKALKEVREEARRKGDQDWQNKELTPEQIKAIDDVSDAYAKQADELRKMQEAMDFAKDLTRGFLGDFVNDLKEGKSVWESFGDAALGVLDKIANKLLDMATDDLINSIFKGLSGGGGFSDWDKSIADLGLGLFDTGGYTGPGGKKQAAGIVHKGEVVWSQDDIARAGGVGVVEAMRRGLGGYADGGPVSAPTMPRLATTYQAGGQVITYAPVYNVAQGADPRAIAELRQAQAQDRAEFAGRVVQTIRVAKKQNKKGI